MDSILQKLLIPIVFFISITFALYSGVLISEEKYVELLLISSCIIVFLWMVFGYEYWWLPMFFFLGLGGFFYFGFKVYLHEIAVLISVLPLVFVIVFHEIKNKRERYKIPFLLWLLFGYLTVHLIGMFIYYKLEGLTGWGNIMRRYMDALWPFLILVPFIYYGKTKYISWALHLFFLAIIIRFFLGFAFYLTEREEFVYVPGINYVLPDAGMFTDLRFSGSMLAILSFCYFIIYKSIMSRILFFILILLGIVGTMFGGGRIAFVTLTGFFLFACFVYRKYWLLGVWFAAMILFVILINSNLELLYSLKPQARRALTGLLLNRELAQEVGQTYASDEWHAALQKAGFEAWTQDFFTFVFGRGTRRFEEAARYEDPMLGLLDMAIVTSRFEKGLWNVLVTFGLVGLVFYSLVLLQVIKYCLPILLRDRIQTPLHAMMFLGVYLTIFWFLLCWISGDFPSLPIFFGVISMIAANEYNLIKEKQDKKRFQFLERPINLESNAEVN
ncbi:MAG: hypothetical protein N2035_03350 [Chthoniobacterales bacterium]|nr:hypothetical protein [Chthoniobacterales bacterium]